MFRKILKITLIVLLVLLGVAFAAPFVFKGKIIKIAKEQINKNLTAAIDFNDLDISFFRHFPKVSVALSGLQVVGTDEFAKDTLVAAKNIDVALNLMSVIKGSDFKIYSITIDEPRIHVIVNKDGKANYNITKPDTAAASSSADNSSPFKMNLEKYAIKNGYIKYDDATSGMSSEIVHLNHEGSGDFTSDLFTLSTTTTADAVSFSYGGIPYLNNTKTSLNADIQVDNKTAKYSFKTDKIAVNELKLTAEGFFQLVNDSTYNMDLKFDAPSTDFRNMLSLVPVVYQKDFASVKTSGQALFNGSVKGVYSATQIPAYTINLGVKDGFFQYPDLPKPVQHINVSLNVDNPDGVTDHTVINISQGHIEMDNEPFDFRLLLKNPMSSRYIDAAAKGKLDLSKIAQFVKLDPGTRLGGIINADVQARGSVTALQKQQVEGFDAKGIVDISNLNYASAAFPAGVTIQHSQLTLTPKNITLGSMTGTCMQTNFSASGSLDNMFGYALQHEPLTGTLNVKADKLDLNKWMATDSTAATAGAANTAAGPAASEPFAVPKNIQFTMDAAVDQLHYDKTDYTMVTGILLIKDETVTMKDIHMQAFDGAIGMNGSYSTAASKKNPAITLSYDVQNLDVQKTFYAFNTVQKLMPAGKFVTGKLSSKLTMKGSLGKGMMPDMASLTGDGTLQILQGVIGNFEPLQKLSSTLNVNELKEIVLKDIKNSFEFANGKVLVKPFNVKVKDIDMQIGGMHGLDQSIDYLINMKLPRSLLGSQGNALINNLTSQAVAKGIPVNPGETVNLAVKMGGTMTNPTVKPDLKGAAGNTTDQLKQQALGFAQAKADSAKRAVKDTVAALKNQAVKQAKDELAKQLLGGGKKDTAAPAQNTDVKKRAEDAGKSMLNNLFNKKKKDN